MLLFSDNELSASKVTPITFSFVSACTAPGHQINNE